jgi:superoxide reductase
VSGDIIRLPRAAAIIEGHETHRRTGEVATERYIRWIQLFFHPEGDKFAYQVANVEFCTHGEAVDGTDEGPVYTHHAATASMKTRKPGVLYATPLSNIHGLWENTREIKTKG